MSFASNHLLLSSARKTEQANLSFGKMNSVKCQFPPANVSLKIVKQSLVYGRPCGWNVLALDPVTLLWKWSFGAYHLVSL